MEKKSVTVDWRTILSFGATAGLIVLCFKVDPQTAGQILGKVTTLISVPGADPAVYRIEQS